MSETTLQFSIENATLELRNGDITKVKADAIGNAANAELAGGGGVDGAIHAAGGPAIIDELKEVRKGMVPLRDGDAVVTGAGRLNANWILHAVGPIYRDGQSGEPQALMSCYRKCLALSDELGAKSLALPAISAGIYGYPLDEAAALAIQVTGTALATRSTRVERITFVLFGDEVFGVFKRAALRFLNSP